MHRRGVPALTLVLAAAVLAACSSSGGDHKATTAPSPSGKNSSPAKSSSSVPPPVQPTTKLPPIKNDADVRKANHITSCAAVPGGWRAKGTMQNKTDADATYQIQIYFTTAKGGTVQAAATTRVAVPTGKTVPWTATATFRAQANTQCVAVGVAPVR